MLILLLLLLLSPCLLLYAIASYCTGRLWPPCALLASMPVMESALTPSGFVSAALRKRLSGDLYGLGRPGSPRGRWIPPFGGRVLHVRTLELYYISRRGKPPCWWAGGSKAVGLAPLLLLDQVITATRS